MRRNGFCKMVHQRDQELKSSHYYYYEIPEEDQVEFCKQGTIRRLKYQAARTTWVDDNKAWKKERETRKDNTNRREEIHQKLLEGKSKRDRKILQDEVKRQLATLKQWKEKERKHKELGPPLKEKRHDGDFFAMVKDGKCELTEDDVKMRFGETFTTELKKSADSRFFDVPVGYCKKSKFYQIPELLQLYAPTLHYTQSEGKDLCLFKYTLLVGMVQVLQFFKREPPTH